MPLLFLRSANKGAMTCWTRLSEFEEEFEVIDIRTDASNFHDVIWLMCWMCPVHAGMAIMIPCKMSTLKLARRPAATCCPVHMNCMFM